MALQEVCHNAATTPFISPAVRPDVQFDHLTCSVPCHSGNDRCKVTKVSECKEHVPVCTAPGTVCKDGHYMPHVSSSPLPRFLCVYNGNDTELVAGRMLKHRSGVLCVILVTKVLLSFSAWLCLGKIWLCECPCPRVCEHLYVLIWPGRPPSLRAESAAGSCLGSPSQLKPAKRMEFPLRIKQGSSGEPNRPRLGEEVQRRIL